jgi:hypothetical protein
MDPFNELLLILLGSLLGILSPGLIDWIRRAHARKPIRKAIEAELDEMRYTLASLAYRHHSHLGSLDHDFLRWQEFIEAAYQGSDKDSSTLAALRQIINQTPDQLRSAQEARSSEGNSLTLKQYALPFLTSQLAVLHDHEPEFQRRVLQVHAQLELLNADVPYLMRQHELTFGNLSTGNYAVVQKNIKDGYRTIANRAKLLADRITQILPL